MAASNRPHLSRPRISHEDRVKLFWSKVDIKGSNDCWIFKGSLRPAGHGQFYLNGVTQGAHRIAYQLTNCFCRDNTSDTKVKKAGIS